MKIKTRFFGEFEVDENKVITFENGIPGFEDLKKYVFMTDEDEKSPFCWLQSIEDTDIVFTLFDVFSKIEDYTPNVEEESLLKLGEFEDDDLCIYCIANIPSDVKEMTINLKAPIVINTRNNKARQMVCNNEDYAIKYYIYKEIKKSGEENVSFN